MKILVTGGTGFLGKNICKRLVQINHNLIVLSRKKNINKSNISYIRSSFLISKNSLKIIREFNPEIVIHLGWQGIPNFSKNNCLKNLKHQKIFFKKIFNYCNVKKIIAAGSCFEYDPKHYGQCKENYNEKAWNYFTITKLKLKNFFLFYCKKNNIKFFWLRIFYVYGENQREKSLIPSLIKSFIAGSKILIKNKYAAKDFIYIDDVVNAVLCAVVNKKDQGTFNIGSGKLTSVDKIIKIIRSFLNKKDVSIKYNNINDYYKNNQNAQYANINRVKNKFKWYPKFSIQQGIKKIVSKL